MQRMRLERQAVRAHSRNVYLFSNSSSRRIQVTLSLSIPWLMLLRRCPLQRQEWSVAQSLESITRPSIRIAERILVKSNYQK